jgi:hypothetical protein
MMEEVVKKVLMMLLGAGLVVGLSLPALAVSSVELDKLTASDAAAFDWFGSSVALSGNTAIVGAFQDDDAGNKSGSAYLYDFSDPCSIIETKLTASDATGGDEFGFSVAISGTTAIVGARWDDDAGSAYLYDFNDPCNITETKLTASDAATLDEFGISVAISGTTALVGAHWDDDAGSASGSAYLFDVAIGSQIAKLTASDAAAGDYFGESVAISGSTALVGATGDDDAGSDSGSAYLFDVSDPCNPVEIAKLTASDADLGDEFGISVAISGSTAIVGAEDNDDAGTDSGSAYLYDFSDPCSITETKLTASDAAANDAFGASVAISGATALVGARLDDDAGTDSGSAYLFGFGLCLFPPAGDLNLDCGVDFVDFGMMCEDWLLEELSADVGPNGGDGFVNFLDWAIFADGWQTTHDIFDLAEFADQWLKTGSNYLIADIAPAPDGDGVVNMRDLATLANNWLAGK